MPETPTNQVAAVPETQSQAAPWFRRWVAALLLGITTAALTAIAITALVTSASSDRSDVAQTLFNALLPVFSAWVGTVIAFYFGRENFESASQQVREIAAMATSSHGVDTRVTDVMDHLYDMVTFTLAGSPADVALAELRGPDYFGKVNRLLIIGSDQVGRYLIHKGRLSEYLLDHPDTDTLQAFLDQEKADAGHEYGPGRGFVVVSTSDTLGKAKAALEAAPGTADIIVTRLGEPTEPAVGWITDKLLQSKLRA